MRFQRIFRIPLLALTATVRFPPRVAPDSNQAMKSLEETNHI